MASAEILGKKLLGSISPDLGHVESLIQPLWTDWVNKNVHCSHVIHTL